MFVQDFYDTNAHELINRRELVLVIVERIMVQWLQESVCVQEVCDNNAHELINRLAPPMIERIVAQRLRESVREQGGLIHEDMQSMRSDISHLRQGKSSLTCHPVSGRSDLLCSTIWCERLPDLEFLVDMHLTCD